MIAFVNGALIKANERQEKEISDLKKERQAHADFNAALKNELQLAKEEIARLGDKLDRHKAEIARLKARLNGEKDV